MRNRTTSSSENKTYYGNESKYPTYDNYTAINVNKVADIPLDYEGAMGVPITFLDKYNPGYWVTKLCCLTLRHGNRF